jgi:2',3'-cyclic-nucleotide 2'-phosphodiesterase (5'-nucleotidase family)
MKHLKKLIIIIASIILTLSLVACNIEQFKVTFDSDGGSLVETKEVNKGELLTKPDDPTKLGFDFIYWQLDNEEYKFDQPVEKDFTLVAKWEVEVEIKYYSVSFNLDGGTLSGLDTPISVKEGLTVNNPGIPTKEGHTFLNWLVDGVVYNFETAVNSNLEIVASYQEDIIEVTYQVTFFVNDEVYLTNTVKEGQKVKEPADPILSGYIFKGWYEEGKYLTYNFDTIVKKNLNLVAKFEKRGEEAVLDIYYINDLHGSILENGSEMGLAKIANLIIQAKRNNPNTIFIAGGDMFQGGALSNINYGKPIIEILDELGIDANILGNHEFDWGIDVILDYYKEGGLAQHPLLSINTFYKGTEDLIEGLEPYTIVELPDFKVAIIGYIDDLRGSIMASAIAPYIFADPIKYITSITKYLREVEKVDFIITAGHNATGSISYQLSDLEIDLFFEAHSHQAYIRDLKHDKIVLQAGSNGKYVGHVRYEFSDGVGRRTIEALLDESKEILLRTPSQKIANLIEAYVLESEDYLKKVIINNGNSYIDSYTLTLWAAKVIRAYYGAEVGYHNSGGTRDSIAAYQAVDLELMYKIFPFDNAVVLVELTYDQLLIADADAYYTGSGPINIVPGKKYLVVANQYVYEYEYNIFLEGNLIEYGPSMRDVLIMEMELQQIVYGTFSVNNPILIGTMPAAEAKAWVDNYLGSLIS